MKKLTTSQIKRELWRINSQICSRLSRATGKTIWRLSEKDAQRLPKLLVWEERYSVTLEYIFQCLIPHCMRKLPKEVRRKLEAGKSLGLRISSLTSMESEKYLAKCVEEDFPDGINVRVAVEQRKANALAILTEDELTTKKKPLLQYKTTEDFVNSYKKRLNRAKKELSSMDKIMARMPYRLNPWRQ